MVRLARRNTPMLSARVTVVTRRSALPFGASPTVESGEGSDRMRCATVISIPVRLSNSSNIRSTSGFPRIGVAPL
jgi:hypothetical protein